MNVWLNNNVSMVTMRLLQMIEMECYKELNVFNEDGTIPPDLQEDQPPPPPRGGFLKFFRRQRVRNKPISFVILDDRNGMFYGT